MNAPRDSRLIHELATRFPLFEQIHGTFGVDDEVEGLPWFLALLLAMATKREPGMCCVVLDKTESTAALIAVLLALHRIQQDFPLLAEDYAKNALTVGERVRVKPSNFVYEYDGIWERHPGKFRLNVLDGGGRRSFHITDALRLEPTTRKRPKGTLNSEIIETGRVGLDDLLNVTTYGNSSISRNVVLLYRARARYEAFANSVALGSKSASTLDRISALISDGSIGPNGEIVPNDAYQVVGEPFVAVSKIPQDLAVAAIDSPIGSKVVIVDGARGITGDLQSLDDMSEHQNVLILASADEIEEIRILREHDCPVWHVTATEVLLGEKDVTARSRKSAIGRTIRAADIRQRQEVRIVDCENSELQTVVDTLERIASTIDAPQEQAESKDLLAELYGVLLGFSECCFEIDPQAMSNLQRARETLQRNQMWVSADIVGEFRKAIDVLETIGNRGVWSNSKADALVNSIIEAQGKWVLGTRYPRTAEVIRKALQDLGTEIPVSPIRDLATQQEWDGIILLAWPNRYRFRQLVNFANAHEIRILAFPFERRWVGSHLTREKAIEQSNEIDHCDLAAIIGISEELLQPVRPDPHQPVAKDPAPEPPMIKFERRFTGSRVRRPTPAVTGYETRRARVVDFVGGSCALVTEWHKLNVLSDLIANSKGKSSSLRLISIDQLSRGDYVIFRADGDKEFIRLLAEDQLGVEEYSEKRELADRWRSAIRSLGINASVVQGKLERLGLYRTLPTISGWIWDPDRIGPREDRDVEIIGKAAGDAGLLAKLPAVLAAISEIRGAHISAGNRLTELIIEEVEGELTQFDGRPILLDLGFGKAWIVEVMNIESRMESYPTDQVNRLLTADITPF